VFVVETENQDDEDWVQRFSTDPTAFEKIYAHYLPLVYRYIYRRVSNQMEAEDLTSFVFLRAMEAVLEGKYRSQQKFAAWLFSIARTKVADYYRDRKNRSWATLSSDIEIADEFELMTDDDDLAKCFSTLSEYEQELLALRFSADLDFQTIGVLMHKKTAAIKMATYRSLQKLRKRMEDFNA
jgi:RNA polymerase sigma factor (sigma-70 family)